MCGVYVHIYFVYLLYTYTCVIYLCVVFYVYLYMYYVHIIMHFVHCIHVLCYHMFATVLHTWYKCVLRVCDASCVWWALSPTTWFPPLLTFPIETQDWNRNYPKETLSPSHRHLHLCWGSLCHREQHLPITDGYVFPCHPRCTHIQVTQGSHS